MKGAHAILSRKKNFTSMVTEGFEKKHNGTQGDGAYYCYCAYVLRISRYSDFLWVVLTNTRILLRGLKLSGEIRTWLFFLVSKKKFGGNHAFFRDN